MGFWGSWFWGFWVLGFLVLGFCVISGTSIADLSGNFHGEPAQLINSDRIDLDVSDIGGSAILFLVN